MTLLPITYDLTTTAITQAANSGITAFEKIGTTGSTTRNLSVTLDNANVAATKTLTVDASALTTGVLTFVGTSEADGSVVVIGGGAADSITGTASALADNLSGGAGNDTFVMAGNLTSADTIDGGAGTDIVSISGTVADTAFTKVTSVETVTDSAAATLTLDAKGQAAGVATVNLFSGGVDTVTVSSGFTGTLTVNQTDATDADVISASASAATLTMVSALAAGLGATAVGNTFTGGTGTSDTITYDLTTAAITQVANSGITAFEKIGTTGSTTRNLSVTLDNANVAATKTLTVDASALTTGVLTFVGTSETNGSVVVIGGGAADSITGTASSLGDSLAGGAGNDTFVMAGNLTTADTIDGGAGTDIVSVSGTVADTGFTKVTNVETLTDSAAAAPTLGALAQAAGVATVNLFSGGVDTVTVSSGFTGSLTVNQTNVTDADVISASGSAATLTMVSSLATGLGATAAGNTYTGGTGTSDTITYDLTANAITQAANTGITGFEKIGTSGSTVRNLSVTTTDVNVASGKTLTVDASALTTGALTFNGSAETNGVFSVTGGAAADTITTGKGADTINAGAGDDIVTVTTGSTATINLGAGADAITFAATGMVTVTGGAGADTFNVAAKTLGGSIYDTISDAATGDLISFVDQGAEAWASTDAAGSKVVLGAAASFSDYLSASVVLGGDSSTDGHYAWFVYGGNTYVVESTHNETTNASFVAADRVVQLTGVVNLTGSTVLVDHTITLAVA